MPPRQPVSLGDGVAAAYEPVGIDSKRADIRNVGLGSSEEQVDQPLGASQAVTYEHLGRRCVLVRSAL